MSKIELSEMTRKDLEIFTRDLEMEVAVLRTENDYFRSKPISREHLLFNFD